MRTVEQKTVGIVLIILMCIVLYIPVCAQPSPPGGINRTIIVAMDTDYPPYSFHDANGYFIGIAIDRWRLWEKQTGISVDIRGMDWSEAQNGVVTGKYDVIDTISYSDERATVFDFSKPYTDIDVLLFFSKDISKITDLDSSRGYVVGVHKGDNYARIIDAGVLVREYATYDDVVKAAKYGEILVFALDKPAGRYYLNKEGIRDQFRMSPSIQTGDLRRAVKKGNTELLNTIEDGFSKIPQSELEALDRKWYGTPGISPETLQYVVFFAGVVLVIAVVLIIWNRTLKRTIAIKTSELHEQLEQRKRAEAELIRNNEELNAAYEELTATGEELKHNYDELNRNQQALEQARKKLSLLNFIAFTDIRNAVFTIAGYLELEKRILTDEKQIKCHKKLSTAAETIENALNFAKTYQDLGIKSPYWQNVKQTFLFGISHLDDLQFSRNLNVEGLEIYADPMLERVFFNLVQNVILHGKTATEIRLHYEETGDDLTLIFEDNGVGIPDPMKEAIFKRKYEERKGVGLFLAKEILEITRIGIRETGTEGKGARFEITVPKGAWRFKGSSA